MYQVPAASSALTARRVATTEKNTTPAGIVAAVVANLVLVGVVWYVMAEDRADAKREKLKKKQ